MKFKWEYLFSVILLFLGLVLSLLGFSTLKLHSDHIQIIDKMVRLLEFGQWTHHGNAATGMGFIPGSFLTAITSGALSLGASVYSLFVLIVFFHFAGFYLFYLTLGSRRSAGLLLLWVVFYWLNPWRIEQVELYNPAFLFLFSGLHIWTCFKLREEPGFIYSVLHVLCLGFCFQIHFSVLVLAFASLFLLLGKKIRFDWRGVGVGVVLVVFSLWPYLLVTIQDSALIPSVGSGPRGAELAVDDGSKSFVGRNLVMVYPVLKAIIYWVRYGSFYLARHVFTEVEFTWIASLEWRNHLSLAFHWIKWPLAAMSLVFSFLVQYRILNWIRSRKLWKISFSSQSLDPLEWQRQYLFYLFTGMLAASSLSPVEFNHWHLILCFPAVAMNTMLSVEHYFQNRSRKVKSYFVLGMVFLSVFMILPALLGSRTHSVQRSFSQDFENYYRQAMERERSQR